MIATIRRVGPALAWAVFLTPFFDYGLSLWLQCRFELGGELCPQSHYQYIGGSGTRVAALAALAVVAAVAAERYRVRGWAPYASGGVLIATLSTAVAIAARGDLPGFPAATLASAFAVGLGTGGLYWWLAGHAAGGGDRPAYDTALRALARGAGGFSAAWLMVAGPITHWAWKQTVLLETGDWDAVFQGVGYTWELTAAVALVSFAALAAAEYARWRSLVAYLGLALGVAVVTGLALGAADLLAGDARVWARLSAAAPAALAGGAAYWLLAGRFAGWRR
jgi:hypothetical protein